MNFTKDSQDRLKKFAHYRDKTIVPTDKEIRKSLKKKNINLASQLIKQYISFAKNLVHNLLRQDGKAAEEYLDATRKEIIQDLIDYKWEVKPRLEVILLRPGAISLIEYIDKNINDIVYQKPESNYNFLKAGGKFKPIAKNDEPGDEQQEMFELKM